LDKKASDPAETQRPQKPEAARMFKTRRKRVDLGKYAFGAMLIGRLTVLRIYSRLSESLNLPTLTTLRQTISSMESTDWQKITLIAFSALIIALLACRSGRRYAHVYSQMSKLRACKIY